MKRIETIQRNYTKAYIRKLFVVSAKVVE